MKQKEASGVGRGSEMEQLDWVAGFRMKTRSFIS